MENRHDDTPVINDYTYYVFEEIEKRGLQFAIPDAWRPLYRSFLRKRKLLRAEIAAYWSQSGSYSDDFGDKGAAAREESSKANNTTGLLEE
jgi:hypothetical protein